MENSIHTRQIWISPECDFEELHRDGRYTDMVNLASQNANLIISICRHHETENLQKSLRYGIATLSYFERSLKKDSEAQAIFGVGKLKGYLEALEKLQFASDQEQLACQRAKLLGTKHLEEIIFALESHGPMSQTELCKFLNLQASTMSEALKKVKMTQLVQVSPYGKYKMYSLTESGVAFGLSLRKKTRLMSEMDEAIEKVSRYLLNPESKDACLRIIKSKFPMDVGVVVSRGDCLSLLGCNCNFSAKFDINLILQQTTNYSEDMLTVFAGALHECSNHLVDNQFDCAREARKEIV